MLKRFIATTLALSAAGVALGSQTLSVSLAVGSPTLVGVDVLTDVSTDDTWTSGGVRVVTSGGATLRYDNNADPNENICNPGGTDLFITHANRPRPVGDLLRLTNAQAEVAGRYNPTGPTATTDPTEVNVAFFRSPPASASTASVDGAIFRAAIDLSGTGFTADQLLLTTGDNAPASHPFVIARSVGGLAGAPGAAAATFDVPALVGINWVLSAVPEPASLALLALGGLALIRRR